MMYTRFEWSHKYECKVASICILLQQFDRMCQLLYNWVALKKNASEMSLSKETGDAGENLNPVDESGKSISVTTIWAIY